MQDFRGLSRQVWNQRYLAQAEWTAHIRQYLFKKINPPSDERILEIGSGTSAVLQALHKEGFVSLSGIDLDQPSLSYAKSSGDTSHLSQADGMHLPYSENAFGVSFCHYLLMWVNTPMKILEEMHRVTRPGGWILALAEPDHQARMDYPPPLDKLGEMQTEALKSQGVDVAMGRKLRSLFQQAGLDNIEVGILGAQWNERFDSSPDQTEWAMIEADLQDKKSQKSTVDLSDYYQIDKQAWQTKKRILFIPTFYALGNK